MSKRQVLVGYGKPHISKQGEFWVCGFLWSEERCRSAINGWEAFKRWEAIYGFPRHWQPSGELGGLRLPANPLDGAKPAQTE